MNLLHYTKVITFILVMILIILIILIYININYNLFILDTRKKHDNIILSSESLGLVNDCKILQNYIMNECNINYRIININSVSSALGYSLQYMFVKCKKFNSIIVVERTPIYLNKELCDNIILVPNSDHLNINSLSIYNTILVKNYFTYKLLLPIHNNVIYMGFTSMIQKSNHINKGESRLQSGKSSSRIHFIHMPGKSPYKGTIQLIQFWKENIEYMKKHNYYLVIIMRHILYLNTIEIINSKYLTSVERDNIYYYKTREECPFNVFDCVYHICTSENEGFGHYINEAKSAGCIVITLDNSPMNDMITNDIGFLIRDNKVEKYNNIVDRYIFNKESLLSIFHKITLMDENTLINMSIKAKESFYISHYKFINNLKLIFI